MFIIREHNNEQSMKTVKCKYCGQKDGVHKMGCEIRKITVNLELTPKERAANYMKLKKGFNPK